MAIVSCQGCDRSLRVPDGKRGTITCPSCGASWFHPEMVELSEVEFRCSWSGARFNVISSRRSPLHKFVIQQIKKQGGSGPPNAQHEPSTTISAHAISGKTSKVLLSAPGARGWLAQVFGRKTNLTHPVPPPKSQKDDLPRAAKVTTQDPNDYNWAGFYCPYCNATSFVSCTGGHLACDGQTEMRNGGRFHQCSCGAAGLITGAMKSITDKRLSVEAQSPARKQSADHAAIDENPIDTSLPPPSTRRAPAKR
jgi:transcription elongation factor Elf1